MNRDVDKETRIILVGRTGQGKSATGNSILGEDYFESNLSSHSVTSKCQAKATKRLKKRVLVVDTPGIFDTDQDEETVFNEIGKSVGISAPGIHAALLVTAIGRHTPEEQETFRLFVKHFGEGVLKHSILIFTGADNLKREKKTFKDFLQKAHGSIEDLLAKVDRRCLEFDNTLTGKKRDRQVQKLFDQISRMQKKNNNQFYTNEMYKEAERMIQNELEARRKLEEEEKEEERRKIREPLQKKVEELSEQNRLAVMEVKTLKKELKTTTDKIDELIKREMEHLKTYRENTEKKIQHENEKERYTNEIKDLMKKAENQEEERVKQIMENIQNLEKKREKDSEKMQSLMLQVAQDKEHIHELTLQIKEQTNTFRKLHYEISKRTERETKAQQIQQRSILEDMKQCNTNDCMTMEILTTTIDDERINLHELKETLKDMEKQRVERQVSRDKIEKELEMFSEHILEETSRTTSEADESLNNDDLVECLIEIKEQLEGERKAMQIQDEEDEKMSKLLQSTISQKTEHLNDLYTELHAYTRKETERFEMLRASYRQEIEKERTKPLIQRLKEILLAPLFGR